MLFRSQARRLIQELAIEPTDGAMRAFRHRVETERPELFRMLSSNPDFYSMSELRDWIFHTHESQHDMLEIGAIVDDLDLEFLGVHVHPEIRESYRRVFPDDPAMTSIANWHRYEIANPGTFGNMYQFWVRSRR